MLAQLDISDSLSIYSTGLRYTHDRERLRVFDSMTLQGWRYRYLQQCSTRLFRLRLYNHK